MTQYHGVTVLFRLVDQDEFSSLVDEHFDSHDILTLDTTALHGTVPGWVMIDTTMGNVHVVIDDDHDSETITVYARDDEEILLVQNFLRTWPWLTHYHKELWQVALDWSYTVWYGNKYKNAWGLRERWIVEANQLMEQIIFCPNLGR